MVKFKVRARGCIRSMRVLTSTEVQTCVCLCVCESMHLGVQTIKKNSPGVKHTKTHIHTRMRLTQNRHTQTHVSVDKLTHTHTHTLTVWWWITLTSCTNAEQPVWAHWSISEHSCYTAQRQHNNTTKTVSLGTQIHTHTHTHTHTHIFTLGHARTGLSNRWEWHYLQGLKRRHPVGAEQEWCLATVQLHNEAQASCQQVLQMNIFWNVSKMTHQRFNDKNVKIRLLWLRYNPFINAWLLNKNCSSVFKY